MERVNLTAKLLMRVLVFDTGPGKGKPTGPKKEADMSVFQNELGGCPPNAKMMSECKRDYEQDIARVKEQEQASVNLSEALVGYLGFFGRGERQFTLTSLYGALLLEQLSLSETVINLQEQWAKEKQT